MSCDGGVMGDGSLFFLDDHVDTARSLGSRAAGLQQAQVFASRTKRVRGLSFLTTMSTPHRLARWISRLKRLLPDRSVDKFFSPAFYFNPEPLPCCCRIQDLQPLLIILGLWWALHTMFLLVQELSYY
jgi:hypothetical protein